MEFKTGSPNHFGNELSSKRVPLECRTVLGSQGHPFQVQNECLGAQIEVFQARSY